MSTWSIPCVRGLIGERVYYSALLKSEQIAQRIQSAHQIRVAKSLEDWLQRKLNDRRYDIANYLCKRSNRFFNSIVVGVFGGLPKWIPFDMEKAALDLDIETEVLTSDSIGLLVFSGREQMFAIDGQHRVEGIRISHEQCPETVVDDEYSVIFIAHIDDAKGKLETRRLFSDINKRAVPVSAGDKVVIDEDELNAIVARRLYADYPPFQGGKLIAITEKEKLPEGDVAFFTNLLTLYAVNKRLRRLFRKPPGANEYDINVVTAFYEIVAVFYDFIIENVDSYHDFFVTRKVSLAAERENNRNLLFRPVGLSVLAQLYVEFYRTKHLSIFASRLKTLNFRSPGGVFDGLLWRSGKVGPRASDRTAAINFCAYLLGLDIEAPSALQKRLAELLREDDYELPKRKFTKLTTAKRK